ncbi:hypothetical protein BMS3Abin03_00361 [bacterium BMS3Abin03]|nr:hypothetical protein BMS3Abin03_00361 [bacterium BMS3Abin03]
MPHLKISEWINNYELPFLLGFIFFGWILAFIVIIIFVLLAV